MERLARVALVLGIVVALLATVGLCGCKKDKFDPNDPGEGFMKTEQEKAATMMKGKGPGDPPPGIGGAK